LLIRSHLKQNLTQSIQTVVKSRRALRISQEGWYYLFVLSFVTTGAVLRQINPLFILTGLMLAPLLINWRLAMAMLRATELERDVPDLVSAGQKFSVGIQATNHSPRIDCWNINLVDHQHFESKLDQTVSDERNQANSHIELPLRHIASEKPTVISYQCEFNQRGIHQLGPIWATTRYPLGLVVARQRHDCIENILVAPRIGCLTPAWHRVLDTPLIGGGQGVPRHGTAEGDFFALRGWRSGDSQRWIHWRTSAKLGELAIRQFEQHVDRSLTILLDLWIPQQASESDVDAVELAASFAATVIHENRSSTSKLAFAVADKGSQVFQTTSGRAESHAMSRLALAEPSSTPNTAAAMQELCDKLEGPTTLIVISTRDRERVTELTSPDAPIDGKP